MNTHYNPYIEEIVSAADARRQAKDMACIKYCGDGKKEKGMAHEMACPYWDPFRRKNTVINKILKSLKGGEKNGNNHR